MSNLLFSLNTNRIASGENNDLELVGKGGGKMKLTDDGLHLPAVGENGKIMSDMTSLGTAGRLRFNPSIGGLELSNTSGSYDDLPKPLPSVTSISPLSIVAANEIITLNGKNFGPRTPDVFFIGNDGTEYKANVVSSVIVNERLRVSIPAEVVTNKVKEPFKLKIVTKHQLQVITEAPLVIDVNNDPVFATNADLGTFSNNSLTTAIPISSQLSATDTENNTPIVFSSTDLSSVTNGNLSISPSGLISGSLTNPGVDSAYSFNVKITDSVNNFNNRTFGFDVSMPSPAITDIFPLSIPVIDASITIVGTNLGRADIRPSVFFIGSDNVQREASGVFFSSPFTTIKALVPPSVIDNSSLEPFAVRVRRPDGKNTLSSAPLVIDINSIPQFLSPSNLATLNNNSCQIPFSVDISLNASDPEENYPLVFSSPNIRSVTNNELVLSASGGIIGTLTNPQQTRTYTFDAMVKDTIGNFSNKTFNIVFQTPPLEVTNIAPLSVPVIDASIVITGIALGSVPPTVDFVGQNSTSFRSQQVSVLSDNSVIKATVPQSVIDASNLEPFVVKITKPQFDPVSTQSPFLIDINSPPFITNNSVLPTINSVSLTDSQSVDFSLNVTDAENNTPFLFTSLDISNVTNNQLTLSQTGVISGTLTNPGQNTTYNFSVRVTDSSNNFSTKPFSLTFNVPDPSINSVSNNVVTSSITTLDIVGKHFGSSSPTVFFVGNDNTEYQVTNSSLSVDSGNDVLRVTLPSGMKNNASKSPFTIKLVRLDKVLVMGTGKEVTVNQLPVFTSNSFLGQILASDNTSSVNISLVVRGTDPDNNLPLTFSSNNLGSATSNNLSIASDGSISGSLNNPGSGTTYNFDVIMLDALNEGPTGSFSFNLSVPVPVALSITNVNNLVYEVLYLDSNGNYNSQATSPISIGGFTIYKLFIQNDSAVQDNYIKLADASASIIAVNSSNTSQTLPVSANYILIAGGGGGGGGQGGGGGAGGVLQGSVALSGLKDLTIGNGGAGSLGGSNPVATNGGNTTAFNLTAVGGGAGGSEPSGWKGENGGSGGGSSSSNPQYFGGNGISGQGNKGGDAYHTSVINDGAGGGGGGAGSVGSNGGLRTAGKGGDGIDLKSFLGTTDSQFYAGGGGGAGSGDTDALINTSYTGLGGSGVGGSGGYISNRNRIAPSYPSARTGSGGGASVTQAGHPSTPGSGGVIFIKMPSYFYV